MIYSLFRRTYLENVSEKPKNILDWANNNDNNKIKVASPDPGSYNFDYYLH